MLEADTTNPVYDIVWKEGGTRTFFLYHHWRIPKETV